MTETELSTQERERKDSGFLVAWDGSLREIYGLVSPETGKGKGEGKGRGKKGKEMKKKEKNNHWEKGENQN